MTGHFQCLERKGHLLTRGVCAETCGQSLSAPNLHCNRSHYQTKITITLNLGAHSFINGFCNLAVPLSLYTGDRSLEYSFRAGGLGEQKERYAGEGRTG